MTTAERLPDDVAEAAQTFLHHARQNAAQGPARKVGRGRTGEPTSLDRLLGKLQAEGKAPDRLPTLADLGRWKDRPATLTDELHARYCAGGRIEVQAEPHRTKGYPCPRCAKAAGDAALRERLERSGVPPRYLGVEWKDLTMLDPFPRLRQATERITQVMAENDSLALLGPPGSGKTQVGVLAAKAALAANHTALVVNLGRLALDVRDGYKSQLITERAALHLLTAPDLLILDDFGAGETDTAAVERRLLYLALEERCNAKKPCILTSNLSPADLAKHLGGRNLGRLQPLEIVEMRHGRNFRLQEGRKSLW